MVLIVVKRGYESQFLFDTPADVTVNDAIIKISAIYNGRLKIERICSEMEQLSEYGTLFPPEIMGLTEDQVDEMKLRDDWGERCIPSGGFQYNKDPIGRRNGKQPVKKMRDLIAKTIEEVKGMVSKKKVDEEKTVTMKEIQQAINLLKGAIMIVYPMKLPPHDVIRMEFENIEDLSGTQASQDVIDPATAQLWFCGKELYRQKLIKDYTGQNDKCKVIMKLSKKGCGAPGREPVMSEEQRKEWMLHAYRRQEEIRKLETDNDDDYLNSKWADSGDLKRSCQGLRNISWRPK